MNFNWIDTRGRYRPRLTAHDEYAESRVQYCERMARLLPNFPAEVLTQWFYEHWADIDRYAWLEFQRLVFERTNWSTWQVLASGVKENQSVGIDQRHYETGVRGPRIERIVEFLESSGTWPVAPVFLENIAGDVAQPDVLRLTAPYHLLEGHHRVALLCVFATRNAVVARHEVWVASLAAA